mmetsp:Transcript_71014/g.185129  ORF Transcript_71014/g.185129 Transcript_71014/m.185129 type:complete len:220 (-) Transcript_71014:722-1381(-)
MRPQHGRPPRQSVLADGRQRSHEARTAGLQELLPQHVHTASWGGVRDTEGRPHGLLRGTGGANGGRRRRAHQEREPRGCDQLVLARWIRPALRGAVLPRPFGPRGGEAARGQGRRRQEWFVAWSRRGGRWCELACPGQQRWLLLGAARPLEEAARRGDLPPRRLWQPRRPGAADAAPGRQPRSPWPVAAGTRHWEWDSSHVDRVAGAVAARGDAVIESG